MQKEGRQNQRNTNVVDELLYFENVQYIAKHHPQDKANHYLWPKRNGQAKNDTDNSRYQYICIPLTGHN